jgi:hypothetical protein
VLSADGDYNLPDQSARLYIDNPSDELVSTTYPTIVRAQTWPWLLACPVQISIEFCLSNPVMTTGRLHGA